MQLFLDRYKQTPCRMGWYDSSMVRGLQGRHQGVCFSLNWSEGSRNNQYESRIVRAQSSKVIPSLFELDIRAGQAFFIYIGSSLKNHSIFSRLLFLQIFLSLRPRIEHFYYLTMSTLPFFRDLTTKGQRVLIQKNGSFVKNLILIVSTFGLNSKYFLDYVSII